jgi:hypothetical protein
MWLMLWIVPLQIYCAIGMFGKFGLLCWHLCSLYILILLRFLFKTTME